MTMQESIERYVAEVQRLNNELHARDFPNTPAPVVSAQPGKRYWRIVLSGAGVHSFVDMNTGDILKAASWKAPAKGVRGNVADLTKGFNAYGADYRR